MTGYLETLSKQVNVRKKRLGQGHGSGRGKTGGRGTKGQNARNSVKPWFEGGQTPLMRRIPMLRGKGKNHSEKTKSYPVSVASLGSFAKNEEVTLASLKKHGIISKDTLRVKILGGQSIDVALKVLVSCSQSAKAAIEKAGGSVSA